MAKQQITSLGPLTAHQFPPGGWPDDTPFLHDALREFNIGRQQALPPVAPAFGFEDLAIDEQRWVIQRAQELKRGAQALEREQRWNQALAKPDPWYIRALLAVYKFFDRIRNYLLGCWKRNVCDDYPYDDEM